MVVKITIMLEKKRKIYDSHDRRVNFKIHLQLNSGFLCHSTEAIEDYHIIRFISQANKIIFLFKHIEGR